MDQLNKMKVKVAKDCAQIANEINDVRAATDEVGRSKVHMYIKIRHILLSAPYKSS